MAVTTRLSSGYPQTMTAGVVYAMPGPALHHMHAMGTGANGAGATIDLSEDGVLFATGVATPFNAVVASPFARASTTDCIVTLKPLA